jgi:hypothetical protein
VGLETNRQFKDYLSSSSECTLRMVEIGSSSHADILPHYLAPYQDNGTFHPYHLKTSICA